MVRGHCRVVRHNDAHSARYGFTQLIIAHIFNSVVCIRACKSRDLFATASLDGRVKLWRLSPEESRSRTGNALFEVHFLADYTMRLDAAWLFSTGNGEDVALQMRHLTLMHYGSPILPLRHQFAYGTVWQTLIV